MDLERSLFDYFGGVRSDLDEIYDWEIFVIRIRTLVCSFEFDVTARNI